MRPCLPVGIDLLLDADWARILPRIKFLRSGCWFWRGAKSRGGCRTRPRGNTYGHVYLRGKVYKVHRVLFALFRWRPPVDRVLDHVRTECPTWCVNPWHLEPVTNEENVARANRRRKRGLTSTGCRC